MSLNTASATAVLRGLTAKFNSGAERANPFYPTVCTSVPSTGADEQYGILGGVAAVREWIDDRNAKELRAADFTLKNKLWEQTQRIPKTDFKDDRIGLFSPVMEMLGQRAAKHPDKLLMDLIIAAESGACFDGQYFFDTDHVWGDSGSQSNDLSYECVNGDAPTAAEMKAAYNAAIYALNTFKDDQGELLNNETFDDATDGVVILCHQVQYQSLLDALTVRLGSTGGDNVVVTRRPAIKVAARMPANRFDVYLTNQPLRPYIFQEREPLSTDFVGLDDLEKKDVLFLSEARYNAGYGAWWTAVRTTLTTAAPS